MIDRFDAEPQRLEEKRQVPVGRSDIENASIPRAIKQASKLAAQDRIERFEAAQGVVRIPPESDLAELRLHRLYLFLEPDGAARHFEDSDGWRYNRRGVEVDRDRIIHAAGSYAVSLKIRGLATELR